MICKTKFTFPSSDELPEGISLSDLIVDSGVVTLGKDESGNYLEEGYIEISIDDPDAIVGKNLIVKATLRNSILHEDFNDMVRNDIRLHLLVESDAHYSNPIPGFWYSGALSWGNRPEIEPDTTDTTGENSWAKIKHNGSLLQFFRVCPNENYRLSFDVNPTNLYKDDSTGEYQDVTAIITYYTDGPFGDDVPDGKFGKLMFRNLKVQNETALKVSEQLFCTTQYDNDQKGVQIRFRIIDADDHLIYTGRSGVYCEDVTVNYSISKEGDPLPAIDPEYEEYGDVSTIVVFKDSYDKSDIKYAAIEFEPNWFDITKHKTYTGEGKAIVDNVSLIRENQIEVKLYYESDVEIQSSTLLTGFIVKEPTSMIRVYLRSHIPSISPEVESIAICDGLPLELTAKGKIIDIKDDRLGFTGNIAPILDWINKDEEFEEIITEIAEYLDSTHSENALTYLVKHGISRWRNALFDSRKIDMRFTIEDGLSISLRDDAAPYYADGQLIATRYRNFSEAGFKILEIIEPGGIVDSDGNYEATFSGLGLADTPEAKATLHFELASQLTELCTSGNTFTFSDGKTTEFPIIKNFQVSVETNSGKDIKWYWILYGDDYEKHIELLNSLASAIKDAATFRVKNSTSIAIKTESCFDAEYFSNLWSTSPEYGLAANLYTYLGINTFSNSNCSPENLPLSIKKLRQDYLYSRWRRKDLAIGAYSETKVIYDPGKDFTEWYRAYGEQLFGKRVARSTLCNLQLPAKEIYYYTIFESTWKSSGDGWVFNPSWKSEKGTYLLNRRTDTGILNEEGNEGGTYGEPSIFYPNMGGKAFFKIGEMLSSASPYRSKLKAKINSPYENYYNALFKDLEGNWIIALWFFRDYEYRFDVSNWLSGAYDTGFEETRLVDLFLKDFDDVGKATLIHLDGEEDERLRLYKKRKLKPAMIKDIPIGEMPVLIKLELKKKTKRKK